MKIIAAIALLITLSACGSTTPFSAQGARGDNNRQGSGQASETGRTSGINQIFNIYNAKETEISSDGEVSIDGNADASLKIKGSMANSINIGEQETTTSSGSTAGGSDANSSNSQGGGQ